ncbi:ABC transporter ATP-binding protein [Paenibacillus mucilaginosus]|uniref:YusV n=3 Tax=Paenibacillus mucilaginosus TaxID=61624 RepID=H6NQK6_9BACL|nr:ABC transporter ATP-binding protein [Paenibacillus mucilaginosus]AEI45824.1 YusV [Paenibacillus mucilaginosus KNP414]AFC33474.1 YusV [Paenibacillus mucilaginosus 3016]AFH65794.1 iron-enterobactin transporter ATP-binding protein [Paenibacillus mucilaginosus K02]MCG7214996.1 ABC transporter ATP-binding protein [Paenibacillus mucilaginosus]WDM27194.1 ABC transporter ATP-binding protein [Paenibacillus mucilaginosus]
MTAIQSKDLCLCYGETCIFQELSIRIPKGKVTVFIGSNGCGKSTLLRSLARLLKPQKGSIVLDGNEISRMSTKEIARRMAMLPQGPAAPDGLTVLQLVKQGRYPYQNWLQQWSKEDETMVQRALELTNMAPLAERTVDSLSGGQRQRAWIAMTLAQGTPTILLDEPTTYLDLAHQIEVLDLLYELNEREQRTIVMVLHDINLACRYADNIVAIKDRKVWAEGRPEDIVNEKLIKDVFDLESKVIEDPLFGTPMIVPVGKGKRPAAGKLPVRPVAL